MTAPFSFPRPSRQAATLLGAATMFVCVATAASGEDTYKPALGPAIDWTVLARLTETFEVDSNRQLDQGENGLEARGVVGVGVSVAGRGKRSSFAVRTGFRAGRSTDNGTSNLNRLDPNLSATATFLGKVFSVNAAVQARTQSTSTSELEDTGNTNLNATRFDGSASVGVTWQASKRDSITVATSAQIVDFSRSVGTFTPSKTFGLSAGWARQATETTSYSFTTSFQHLDADGADNRTSRSVSARAGIQHKRTSRHTLGGSAGLSFVSTDRANGRSNTQIGFVGGGSFGYKINEFSASLGLNQSIQPSADGDLNAFTSLTGNIAYKINELQRLGFNIRYSRRSDISGGGDVLQFITLGPTYSYSLSKDSSLSLGYQFRMRDDESSDLETGHQVMLTLSHELTLLQ